MNRGADITQTLDTLTEQYQYRYDEIRRSLKDNIVSLEGIRKGPVDIPGYSDTLRCYQTLFLPPQDSRIRQACADLIMFQEEVFEPVQVHLNFQVYRGAEVLVILCFEGQYGFKAIDKHVERADRAVKLFVFHAQDFQTAQERFATATVAYVPTKMKQLFTS